MSRTSLFLGILSLGLGACVHTSPTPSAQESQSHDREPSAAEAFHSLVESFEESSFRFSPTYATATGVHTYDSKLEDRSSAAVEERIRELKSFQAKLKALDSNALNQDETIDAKALRSHIQSELYTLESLRPWEHNPMGFVSLPGAAIDSLMKRDFAPAKQRLEAVIARMQEIPKIYEHAKKQLKNPPKEHTELAIRMAEGSLTYFSQNVKDWAHEAAGHDPHALQQFQKVNARVLKASRDFARWLKQDLLPRSKGPYAIGQEAFLTLLRNDEMIDLPMEQLLAIGEQQLAKDTEAFIATAREIDPKKSPAAIMRQLSDEHPTREDLIPSVRRTLEESRQFLIDHQIITVPSEVRPTVAETPLFDRSGTFASMDTPGSQEKKATEAYYYVTPAESFWTAQHQDEHLRAYNPYVVSIINIHEAFPGHYLQFLYAPQYPTKVRKIVSANSNSEGWAHYTEQMMIEQGFGKGNPKYRLAQLQEALLRDCRFIVGIKLHTAGWTVEQGTRFFQERGFQEAANAREETLRGTYNPTYLYYTYGKIEIQKLRDEYLKKKGGSLRDFHDAFVRQGPLPLPLMREVLLR